MRRPGGARWDGKRGEKEPECARDIVFNSCTFSAPVQFGDFSYRFTHSQCASYLRLENNDNPPLEVVCLFARYSQPDFFCNPMYIVESIQHDETKTPGRYITQDPDVNGHYSVHVFRQCVSASALAHRNLPAALQTTLLNDTEGLLAAWKRIMLTCDPVTLAAFLLLAKWVIRVFRLQ